MKKLFIACSLFLALGLVSCDSNKEACWEYTVKVTIDKNTSSTTSYVWGTKEDVKEAIKTVEDETNKLLGGNGKVSISGPHRTNAENIQSCH